MAVQYMHDGTEAIVAVEGRRHHFSIDGAPTRLENYDYDGPDEEAPDDVVDELEAWIDEHIDPSWRCDDCQETFDSQQAYAAHFPCEGEGE